MAKELQLLFTDKGIDDILEQVRKSIAIEGNCFNMISYFMRDHLKLINFSYQLYLVSDLQFDFVCFRTYRYFW